MKNKEITLSKRQLELLVQAQQELAVAKSGVEQAIGFYNNKNKEANNLMEVICETHNLDVKKAHFDLENGVVRMVEEQVNEPVEAVVE